MSDENNASDQPKHDTSGYKLVEMRQKNLIEEFSQFQNWEDRYKYLINRGKKLKSQPKELYDEKFKVKGCQSQVWLHASITPQGRVEFVADSDALIVKGLVSVLVDVYSGATPDEILQAPTQFLKDLGFETHLSPSRANGLYAMLKQILFYATAFRAWKT